MSSLDRECYVRLAAEVEAAVGAYDVDGPVVDGIEVDEALGAGHPFNVTTWEVGPVEITDEGGAVIFSEPSAEFPESWGAQARTIVAQKYFYGDHGQGFRETSLKQLLLRVTARIALWAMARRTFRTGADARNFYHSLMAIQLRQEFAFNSPIYFNVGIDIYEPMVSRENYMWDGIAGAVVECPDANKHPQVSACFIQSVRDNMMSIMRLATSEAMIFKRGSGSGTDLSPLRSCREKLSGGGRPSGPLSFMRIYDAVAAVVKSGGKCLAPYQPVFTAGGIVTVRELAESGRDFTVLSFDKSAGRVKAKTARAWCSGRKIVCALVTDKGEFHLSSDHPVMLRTGEFVPVSRLWPGTSLMASSVYPHNHGYTYVKLENGLSGVGGRELLHRIVAVDVCGWDVAGKVVHHGKAGKSVNEPWNLSLLDGASEHASLHAAEAVSRGEHVFQTRRFPKVGEANGMHGSSAFWTGPGADDYRATQGAILKASGRAASMQEDARRIRMLNLGYKLINEGYDISTFELYVAARKASGRRCASVAGQAGKFDREFGSYDAFVGELSRGNHRVVAVREIELMDVYDIEVDCPSLDDGRAWSGHNFAVVPIGTTSMDGSHIYISNSRRAAKMQTLKCDHPDIIEFIVAKGDEEKKAQALIVEGYEANFNGEAYSSVFFQNSNLSVRVTDEFMGKATGRVGPATYDTIARTTGEVVDTLSAPDVLELIADRAHFCGDPGLQFEDTIRRWHTVPGHGPINSSNPCAEYMHIDDSACNLASINAMKMMDEDLSVNIRYMRAVIDVMTVAMETVVDEGSYPTPEIALNSHRFRPLGGGYANVGAYVMALGVAYDSDEARSFVAAFTSLLTARMYRRSAELARLFGAFDGFAADRDNMLNVIYNHQEDTRKLFTGTWYGLARAALDDWADAHAMGSVHGFRNSQASCIAPTGTIAFMMGCDTLGIEPEIALVRYKHLAGRGVLKLTSRVVRVALESLGYDAIDRDRIIDHIRRFGTIQDIQYEGPDGLFVPSGLHSGHLPVFDCAFAPPARGVDPIGARWVLKGEGRYISAAGHVDMMAAATPFVSGAISKTVNMPGHCTANDIRGIYVRAWETGCKAIAVYRDNSKGSQPITTAAPAPAARDRTVYDQMIEDYGFKKEDLDRAIAEARTGEDEPGPVYPGKKSEIDTYITNNDRESVAPVRRKLPDTRESVTHKFSVEGHEGYVIVGLHEDKSPGEVFVSMAKNGSTVGGLLDSLGIMISLGLQYGVPLAKIVEKLANQRFEPRGVTIDRDVPFATSIVDYIAKWLGCYFIPGYRETVRPTRGDDTTPAASHGPAAMDTEMVPTSAPFAAEIHGKACPACGSIMVRQGPCYMCFSCGFTDGGCGG